MKSYNDLFYCMSRVPFLKKHMQELREATTKDGLLRGRYCAPEYGGLHCIMMPQNTQGAMMSASMSVNHRGGMRCHLCRMKLYNLLINGSWILWVQLIHRGRGLVRYIITATNYMTRWVTATPIVDCTAATASKFIFDNIVTQFGCPKILMSD